MKSQYKAVKVFGVKVNKHRRIMEEYLLRKLDECEVVHHCNGNKLDNRIKNLELMLLSDHSRQHMTGKTISKALKEVFDFHRDKKAKIAREGMITGKRKCYTCKELLPNACFSKNKANPDGLCKQCKSCRSFERSKKNRP